MTISARQAYPLLFGFIRCANGRCCSQAFVLGRDLNLADSLLQYQQMQKLFQVQHAFALGILLTFIYVSKFTFQVKQWVVVPFLKMPHLMSGRNCAQLTHCMRLKIWEEGDQFQVSTWSVCRRLRLF